MSTSATDRNEGLENLEKQAGRGFDKHTKNQREARPGRLKTAGVQPGTKGQKLTGTTSRPGVKEMERFAVYGPESSSVPQMLPNYGRAGIGGKAFRNQSHFREEGLVL